MAKQELVERVVVGGKSFSYKDLDAPKGEQRKRAQPGATIKVPWSAANAFPHRLQDPTVAAANAEAQRVAAEAKRVAEAAEIAARHTIAPTSADDDSDADEE